MHLQVEKRILESWQYKDDKSERDNKLEEAKRQRDQDEDSWVDPRYAEQDEDPVDHIIPPKKKRIPKVKF